MGERSGAPSGFSPASIVISKPPVAVHLPQPDVSDNRDAPQAALSRNRGAASSGISTLLHHCLICAGLRPRDNSASADRLSLRLAMNVGSARLVGQFETIREEDAMATGTVKWFNATKGFGFIQPDAGGPDVFVHISAVERAGMRDLNEGQKIAYEIVADKRSGKSSADNLKSA